MAGVGDDFRIPQFFPSLAHIAAVRVAIHFFKDSVNDFGTLDRVYVDIQHGIKVGFNEGSQNDRKAKRLHERFLLIPRHLRHTVYQSVMGLCFDYLTWYRDNITDQFKPYFKRLIIFLRSDGSFDRIKIARRFVMNKNVNIRLRFYFACLYCIEKSVLSLWKEMEACGETINFDTSKNWMMNFWVKWMQEGSQVSWLQALKEYFTNPPPLMGEDRLLISPFFALLQPEERAKFLTAVKCTRNYNDFLLCLRAATKEEKVKMLENNLAFFLMHHLNWPLQNIFLEVAEMVWHFLDTSSFIDVLLCIWKLHEERKDFDYSQLFQDFWDRCPNNLKETVKDYPTLSKKINSILNKIRKRKRRLILEANRKKWIRRAGRLEKTTSYFV